MAYTIYRVQVGMGHTKPSSKREDDSLLAALVLFALIAWGMFALLWDNSGKLSNRLDRLEADNALQQQMIKDLGKRKK